MADDILILGIKTRYWAWFITFLLIMFTLLFIRACPALTSID